MLTAIMLLIVSIALIVVGLYSFIKRKNYVPITGHRISSEEKFLPHAQEPKYYFNYRYYWNGTYIVSTDHKASKKELPINTEHQLLINPEVPTDMILAKDRTKSLWAVAFGCILLICSMLILMPNLMT